MSLSEKEALLGNVKAFHKEDLKKAVKELEDFIEFRKQFGQISEAEIKNIMNEIKEIFGEKLI